MSPLRQKLLWLALAATVSASAAGGLSAQESAPPRAGESGTGSKTSVKPSDADPGAKARRETEARQRTWDRKMKAVSGSICRGC